MNPGNPRFNCYCAAIVVAVLSLPSPPAQAYSAGQWRSAEEIYGKVCGYCHDFPIAPSLFGRDLPSAYIRAIVLQGRGPMPAFRPTDFSEEELAALGAFLQKERPARADHAPGGRR